MINAARVLEGISNNIAQGMGGVVWELEGAGRIVYVEILCEGRKRFFGKLELNTANDCHVELAYFGGSCQFSVLQYDGYAIPLNRLP